MPRFFFFFFFFFSVEERRSGSPRRLSWRSLMGHGQALFPLLGDECRQDDAASAGGAQLPRERGMSTMLFVAGHYRKDEQAGYIASRIGLQSRCRNVSERATNLFRAHRGASPRHATTHCVFRGRGRSFWRKSRSGNSRVSPTGLGNSPRHVLRAQDRLPGSSCFLARQALLAIADELREVRTICRLWSQGDHGGPPRR